MPLFESPVIGPIIGVVDGSNAAPGEVGEFITALGTFNFTGATSTSMGTITLINAPPGDWDFTVSASFSTLVESVFFALSPVPVGMSNSMVGFSGTFTAGLGPGMDAEDIVLIGQSARGSFAVTTALSFVIQIIQNEAGLLGGVMTMRIEGRRRR